MSAELDARTELPRAAVSVSSRSLWRLRLARGIPRYFLCAMCAAGLLASARYTIAPPGESARAGVVPATQQVDLAAQAYAALFVRRYLTWNASQPQASAQPLAAMVGPGLEAAAGLRLPETGEQRVYWAEVVQAREPRPDEHVYTVAAQTDAAGLVYLTVAVARTADRKLALVGYPAFVGAPATSAGSAPARLEEVTDPALAAVVERALRNYLARSYEELAADLTSDARVSVPGISLVLESVQRVQWSEDRRSVVATVQAADARGARYALTYELDVADVTGRWEVSAIQTDPTA